MSGGAPVRHEVKELVRLAGQRDRSHRTALYENIVDLFEREHSDLSESERGLMSDILRRLAHDVEMSIRVRLAERLAGDETAPCDLILLLANDQIEVAKPVLLSSRLLHDNDLVEIVYHKTIQHQLSIAARENLGAAVSSALVRVGNETVVTALLNNRTAAIPKEAFVKLVDRSADERSLQAPLVNREDLPVALVEKMYAWVSDTLRATILDHFPVDSQTLDTALSGTVDELVAETKAKADAATPDDRLVDKLYRAGQLTPGFLVKSLNQGNVGLFERGFARLVNLNADIFRKVIYNRGPDALAVACNAIGIDRSAFLTLYRLIRKARNMSTDLADQETGHAFEMFEKMDKRMAEITIHRWAGDENRAPIF